MRSREKFLLRALVVSLLVHFLVFGVWRLGQTQGWWQALTTPHWLQAVARAIARIPTKKAVFAAQPVPLMFVTVDPSLATEEPTKPKYFGAHSTVAANPKITRPSDAPEINGRQSRAFKTTDEARLAKPAQPKAPQQQPHPAVQEQKKSYQPGDLAMAKPSTANHEKDGTSEQASAQPPAQAVLPRPRTIEEALARNGLLGQKTRQDGGVNRISNDSAVDVKGTITGGYFQQLVQSVQQRWDQLLQQDPANASGKVVLNFRLHSDGTISDTKVLSNEVTDLLAFFCQQAIRDPAPYPKWPEQMRLENAGDSIELTFTFYYETY